MIFQKNNILLFLLLLYISFVKAQNSPVELVGNVKFDSINLPNITIINLNTKKGTYSNKDGNFTMLVSLGDSLTFSSLAYSNRKIIISNQHITKKEITVYLEPDVNQLEEVFIESYSKLKLGNVSVLPNTHFDIDNKSIKYAPDMSKVVDPTQANAGINFVSIFKMLTKKLRSKKRAEKEEKKRINYQKEKFLYKLQNQLGNDFFITWLYIKKDKIPLFLDYCIANGLADYYNKDKIYLTDFLVKQSKKFNSIEK